MTKERLLHMVVHCVSVPQLWQLNDDLFEYCRKFYLDNVQWVNNLFVKRKDELVNDNKR